MKVLFGRCCSRYSTLVKMSQPYICASSFHFVRHVNPLCLSLFGLLTLRPGLRGTRHPVGSRQYVRWYLAPQMSVGLTGPPLYASSRRNALPSLLVLPSTQRGSQRHQDSTQARRRRDCWLHGKCTSKWSITDAPMTSTVWQPSGTTWSYQKVKVA